MLDSQTTLILAALLFLLLSILVWWITAEMRSTAVIIWCAGSVLACAGIVLMGLRPWIAPWVSFHAANTCLLVCFVFWSQSLRISHGRPWTIRQMVVWAIIALAYYSALSEWTEPNQRGIGMRLGLGALALYTALLAGQLAMRLRSHNAGAIALAFAVLGFVLWLQMVMHGGGGTTPNPFGKTWDASLLAAVALSTAAVVHLCYAGMVLDRSAQERLSAIRARTAEKETAWLNSQLRQVDRQGRMLLVSGSLAHELNQPLTAALTQAQVTQRRLRMGPLDPAVITALLDKVASGILRTSSILDRIRASGHSREPNLVRVDLREVTLMALELLEEEWRESGIRVERSMGQSPMDCLGDDVSLLQVLVNLLRNATQAVENGTHRLIQVKCLVKDGEALVIVRDHGPGIPSSVVARWGEPFVGTRKQGLGLGLAISLAIVNQHRGKLTQRNHPEGGSEAVLALHLDQGTVR